MGHLRVFDSAADFWLAFGNGVWARLVDLRSKGQTETVVFANLSSFSLGDVRFSTFTPEVRRLFDQFRPQEQQKVIVRAVDVFVTTGKTPSSTNAKETLGIIWTKATGRGPHYCLAEESPTYAMGAMAHNRVFDNPDQMQAAFRRQALFVLTELVHHQGADATDVRVARLVSFLQHERAQELAPILRHLETLSCED